MFKVIASVVLLIVVALLIFAATRPDLFRVERSGTIQASPEKIHRNIADFRQWQAWSPYEKLDPSMKRDYQGVAAGKGSIYAWDGNSKAGAGRMEILDDAPSSIRIQLDFIRPFAARNTAEFTLVPAGNATRVTWAMYGPDPYIGKLIGLFFNRDRMIGKDFEAGLGNLKTISETP